MRPLALLLGGAIALAAGSLASAQSLKDIKPRPPLTLADQGSFYVGGRKAHTAARTGAKAGSGARYSDPPFQEGDWTVDQMYVQFQTPLNAKGRLPVVMTHGCCLSAKTWETTPDGRMGWNEYFVRNGRATYLTDQVGRARSGFDATPYNLARQGRLDPGAIPTVNMATEQMAWWVFRIGPKPGEAFPDQRFPMAYIDQMWKQVIPDLSAAVATPTPTLDRLAELSNDLGGAVLIGHSQSGFFPQGAALKDPRGVRAMISLEPGSCSASTLKEAEWAILARIPSLIVFGDHLGDVPVTTWTEAAKDCTVYVEKIRSMGGDATYISLPALGIKGNGHMFMQDDNSLEIADLVLKWIDDHAEKRR